MAKSEIEAVGLTSAAFRDFGDVIQKTSTTPDVFINQGRCGRFHNLANLNFVDGEAGISLFDSEAASAPFRIEMVERHPLGSQAFIPLNGVPYLVVVAEDDDGRPTGFQAFVAAAGQVINIHRNVWHGVLTPIEHPGQYIVVDRIGKGNNLEEHWLEQPLTVSGVTTG
ncbi:ureidoglycolate lyase [Roseovarius sp. 2305UL8-3]|uniref:ureidoglycolate lyase n=1 Tax=Roseovarius conchicola TaxID=3121636 RepID=UPI00352956A9